jgi:hypothetical protein
VPAPWLIVSTGWPAATAAVAGAMARVVAHRVLAAVAIAAAAAALVLGCSALLRFRGTPRTGTGTGEQPGRRPAP